MDHGNAARGILEQTKQLSSTLTSDTLSALSFGKIPKPGGGGDVEILSPEFGNLAGKADTYHREWTIHLDVCLTARSLCPGSSFCAR